MKKILASLLIVAAGISSAYAKVTYITDTNHKPDSSVTYWKIDNAGYSYGLINLTSGSLKAKFFTNEDILLDDGYYKADKVTLTCNGVVQDFTPGGWKECDLNADGGDAYISVSENEFHYGAEGVYEW